MNNNAGSEDFNVDRVEEPSMEYGVLPASDGLVVEMIDGHPAYRYPAEPRTISQSELEECLSVEECRSRLTDIINHHYEG